jgi:hypothetical protein
MCLGVASNDTILIPRFVEIDQLNSKVKLRHTQPFKYSIRRLKTLHKTKE